MAVVHGVALVLQNRKPINPPSCHDGHARRQASGHSRPAIEGGWPGWGYMRNPRREMVKNIGTQGKG
jgi:hypothetical protein